MAESLQEAFDDFWDDLDLEVESTGESSASAFFGLFAGLAAGNGDCTDLAYTPVPPDRRGRYQIDGYAVDAERNELHVAVSDFRQSRELEPLNSRELEALFQRVCSFVEFAVDPTFVNSLEEESDAFRAAHPIFESHRGIRRIRMILLSNARLATRSAPTAVGEVLGIPVVRNILDFGRYADIVRSKGAPEPIEIDVAELNGGPLPCLSAHGSSGTYEAYLVALPGELLAKIYGLWGARLLEQNVRSFLQAKTKVNRGIIETLVNYPGMFFAYNNGLTATASGMDTVRLEGGALGIKSIHNLQIVNGGQTTASILYAKDNSKADLSDVFVQMKLSVVEPHLVEEVVPDISRFANTQNKVNEADFFSNHPFHVEMEKLSRRITAPPKPGSIAGSKWYYERARGQYRYGQAYGSTRERNRFQTEFPRDQVISKLEVAKYTLTFDRAPHIVSKGETKFFLEFAESVGEEWTDRPENFNDTWFRSLVAKAIIFRRLDKRIGLSDWYKEDRGYKAQTVTYTIAWLVEHLADQHKAELNLQHVWNEQAVPEVLEDALVELSRMVAEKLRDSPPSVKNVQEYCKQKICWDTVRKFQFPFRHNLSSFTIPREEVKRELIDARKLKRIDQDIELDVLMLKLVPIAPELIDYARRRGLLSPKSNAALTKISRNRLTLATPERNALKNLLTRVRESGFKLPSAD